VQGPTGGREDGRRRAFASTAHVSRPVLCSFEENFCVSAVTNGLLLAEPPRVVVAAVAAAAALARIPSTLLQTRIAVTRESAANCELALNASAFQKVKMWMCDAAARMGADQATSAMVCPSAHPAAADDGPFPAPLSRTPRLTLPSPSHRCMFATARLSPFAAASLTLAGGARASSCRASNQRCPLFRWSAQAQVPSHLALVGPHAHTLQRQRHASRRHQTTAMALEPSSSSVQVGYSAVAEHREGDTFRVKAGPTWRYADMATWRGGVP
jgi:hypothetical protein